MRCRVAVRFSIILIITISLIYGFAFAETDLDLTEEERQFIEKNGTVTIAVDPEFSPYEFIDSDGIYKGITADYLKLIEINTGLTFEIIEDLTWTEAYDLALEGKVDLLPCVGITKQRQECFLFSDVYLTYQRVILSRVDSQTYDVSDLDKITVGVQKNSSHNSYLASETKIEPVLYNTNDELLIALSYGEIDAAITNYASSSYRLNKLGITNIEVDKVFDDSISELGMAINPEKEILVSIINKGLASITEEEKININNKWFGIVKAPDYKMIIRNVLIGVCIMVILFGIFIYWNYTLKREIAQRKIVEDKLIKAKKEADDANSAKSTFLAHMSHEIRTPLNAINGLTYLLENTKTSTIQARYIGNLKDASYNLLNVINDILDFSKIEAGEVQVEQVEFSLDRLLDKVSSILMPKAESKGLNFHVKRDVTIPDKLIGDPTKIEQILINFLNNAMKFTNQGEVQLNVEIVSKSYTRCELKFCVKDTGIGISDEQKKNLFIPFHQLDSSVTRKYGGTGLGLSISKNIAELLNGKIGVKSTINVGSEFNVTLPFIFPREDDNTLSKNFHPNLSGIKALLVDEDKVSQEIVVLYLESFNVQVDTEVSVKSAFSKMNNKDNAYNLLIIEMNMTGENSLELVEHVTKFGVEVIIISSHVAESQYEIAESYGVNHIIMKPIISSILYDSIVQCFKSEIIESNQEQNVEIDKVDSHNILLVEDNEVNQIIEKEILEQKGYKVVVANDGNEAVSIMKTDISIELILMDIHMPVCDGYKATELIRGFNTTVPILAMTAESFNNVKAKTEEVGMNGYVTKPVEPEKLFAEIEKHIYKDVEVDVDESEVNDEIHGGTIKYDCQHYIDIKQGLARIGNKEKLYYEILEKFYEDTKRCENEVSRLMSNKEHEEARKLVHKVKGTSGNIGAFRLFQSSKTLNSALQEGIEVDLGPYVWEFEKDLNKTLEVIDTLLHECMVEKEISVIMESNEFTKELKKLMTDFEYLLSTGDLDAFKVYDEIQKTNVINNEKWDDIGREMKNYRFEAAYEALKDLLIV